MSELHVPQTEEFKALSRMALACLGRNVLHFQRLETQLKCLVLICDVAAPQDDFASALGKRAEELRTTTMGNLVNELHQQLYGKPAEAEDRASISKLAVRIQFRLDGDPNYIAQQKKKLGDLVQERNNLIHQDLAEFDPNSEESCRRWIVRLDEQNARVEAQVREFQQLLNIQNEGMRHLMASNQAGEGGDGARQGI
jgi:hypothetical protein